MHLRDLLRGIAADGFQIFVPTLVQPGFIEQIEDSRQTADQSIGEIAFFQDSFRGAFAVGDVQTETDPFADGSIRLPRLALRALRYPAIHCRHF